MAQKAVKKDSDAQGNEERIEAEVEEFLPYACHYDPHTLLTKNGELLQVIKVTGFNFESVTNERYEGVTVRRALRRAVTESIKTNDYALWVHTVRRKKDLSTGGEYEAGSFPETLNKQWIARHDWEHQYMNELYITVIREGQSLSITDMADFFRSLLMKTELRYRESYLEEISVELHGVVENILSALKSFGVRRLEVVKRQDGVYYSEPLEFLSKLVNLAEIPFPMVTQDLSEVMPSRHQIMFGFNALEVIGETGKHFGALLTVKEYHEVSTRYIDEFLQLPQQFVISEAFDFVNSKKALSRYKEQDMMLRLSRDELLGEVSGLKDIMASDTGSDTDYGEHQITIMLVEDGLKLLEEEVAAMVGRLKELGILVFREDVFMEDCFWGMLPANFEFIHRLSHINTRRIGGYASLYNFPAGKLKGNHWGPAVTVFYTADKTPYFFNFHYGDNGHTVIIGPFGAGKTVLLNFLVSESQKFNCKLFFFDKEQGSEIFIRAIGGKYRRILRDEEATQLHFNPLHLPDTAEHQKFLKEWFASLMSDNGKVDDANQEKIEQALAYAYSLPEKERTLNAVLPKFWPYERLVDGEVSTQQSQTDVEEEKPAEEEEEEKDELDQEVDALLSGFSEKKEEVIEETPEEEEESLVQFSAGSVEERLSLWYDQGRFSHMFNSPQDELRIEDSMIFGFGVTHMVQDQITLIPVLSYLFHCIDMQLDGTPTMIVLDEAWDLVDNPVFAPHMEEWLDDLRAKNTMVIFATESVDNAEQSSITKTLIRKIETEIFLPNSEATEAYKQVFGLSEDEISMLKKMSRKKRQFLLKHSVDAVVAELDLSGMDDMLAVLAATVENLSLMQGAILDSGENPEDWLPLFMERIKM